MLDRPSRIVVVEDEPSDITFLRKAFERGRFEHGVVDVPNGVDLFAHLVEAKAAGELPDLILLDLNLPGQSGLDILQELRSGEVFANAVVIVLTSSSYRQEVAAAYTAGANAYVTKPARLADLDDFVCQLEDFWLTTAYRPNDS